MRRFHFDDIERLVREEFLRNHMDTRTSTEKVYENEQWIDKRVARTEFNERPIVDGYENPIHVAAIAISKAIAAVIESRLNAQINGIVEDIVESP